MKIICIGRNYAKHAEELKNAIPDQPVVFMKPSTALLVNNKPFYYPDFTNDLHYELEIVLRVVKNGRHVQPEFALSYFEEIGLGIDFTARDLQAKCKEKRHPWEIAKGFDNSAVLSPEFVPVTQVDLGAIEFELLKNEVQVQHGNTKDLLFPFKEIITYVSKYFKLQTGDLIYTGTPAGVGPVQPGDLLEGILHTSEGPKKLLHCQVK